MKTAFFTATENALESISSTFGMVWPIATSLWNMRQIISLEIAEKPEISDADLAEKYSRPAGIHGTSFHRDFLDTTWDKQQEQIAWILLNATVSTYEGWLHELKETVFPTMNERALQFPDSVLSEVNRLTQPSSNMTSTCFHAAYGSRKHRDYGKIEDLLRCYRVFKEARNCYMHHGSFATDRLVDICSEYENDITPLLLGFSEIPEFPSPTAGHKIDISLRGVVGFSGVVIKIIVSLDSELLRAQAAEDDFVARYQAKHSAVRTLGKSLADANDLTRRSVEQCGYLRPDNIDAMKNFLVSKELLKQWTE